MRRSTRRALLAVQILSALGVLASVIASLARGEIAAPMYDGIRFFALGLAAATIPINITSLYDDADEPERDTGA